ncbi:hypothetical protein LSH36_43g08035 [Paralvinella palmiformis]|uniref:Uncharacterized protein n=1 Tax=Paralvinella palmiformis TaxID=53620 RepID=A0AAD9NF65_9ANNE|nr:hypothetical protein LSH36_43g08035 [Paralvinella palmiformis]
MDLIHRMANILGREIRPSTRLGLCTHGVFRKYYEEVGYLPSDGQWLGRNDGSVEWKYQSNVCCFQYDQPESAFMRQCFTRAEIGSIVTIGDSNAQRYWLALWRSVRAFSKDCRILGSERIINNGTQPDLAYYTKGSHEYLYEKILTTHHRYCRGCGASNGKCLWQTSTGLDNASISGDSGHHSKSAHIKLEHLPMTMILSTSLRFLILPETFRDKKTSSWIYNYFAQSSAEFYFKYYLDGRYPDVLLVFLPLNHVKFLDARRVQLDIKTFHALLKMYIPRSTKVFYMPSFMEFERTRKNTFWNNKLVDGLLAWQRIDRLNRILYDVIEEDLLNVSSGIYSFFDLIDMSKDRQRWSTDGVHMERVWYSSVIRSFWHVYCNSLFNKMF